MVSLRAVSITMGTPDSARISRQTSMPSLPGSIRSSSTTSGRNARNARHRLVTTGDDLAEEALVAQHEGEHLGQGGIVVDDEHPGPIHHLRLRHVPLPQ